MSHPEQPDSISTQEFPAKSILWGVSGSIASTSVPASIMWMQRELNVKDIKVVMTRQATTLVAPRALAAVAGSPVIVDDDDHQAEAPVPHVNLTLGRELFLVMPATANVLGKAAHGIADDLLTTCILAAECPVIFVPCMNKTMWSRPVVKRNIAVLEEDGYGIIRPSYGYSVATGEIQEGAMPSMPFLAAQIGVLLQRDKRTPGGFNKAT